LTDEINAHFHQSATQLLKSFKNRNKLNLDFLNMKFNVFKDTFIFFYNKHAFESLNEDNRKKVLSRIYLFYKDLLEIAKKKQEAIIRKLNKE
jgi:hypothetical protein